jgi:NADH-quinone oxidoreductase subunit M
VLAALFLIATFATLAMPGSANFVGEFLILLGTFKSTVAVSIIASVGVVLASVYALRLYIRSMHNRVGRSVVGGDLRWRDALVLVPMIAAIVAFALYPQQALHDGQRAVRASVARAVVGGGPQTAAADQTASTTQGVTP